MLEYFKDINYQKYKDYTIILDVDGTLLVEGENIVGKEESVVVEKLKANNQVFIFSNNRNKERSKAIADQLVCPYLDSPFRKPNKRILNYLPENKKPILVIGDKFLTDIVFARIIKADYILVKSKRSKTDSMGMKLFCYVDDIVSKIFLRNN
jgi:predicted HAD superfamily phosphohydrolase YqeG